VNDDSALVLYDDSRLYFMLALFGFPMDQVKVLNGGAVEWTAFNQLSTDPVERAPGNVTLKDADPTMLVEWTDVYDNVVSRRDPNVVLLDARPHEMHTGKVIRHSSSGGHIPGAVKVDSLDGTARALALILAAFPAGIALALMQGWLPGPVLVTGLILFGVVFAINPAVHSYLILAYSDFEKVSLNVGFYYMANTGGGLAGTVLSGLVYQTQGLEGCLWWSAGFVLAAWALSWRLPEVATSPESIHAKVSDV
jgi:hypothetical protein